MLEYGVTFGVGTALLPERPHCLLDSTTRYQHAQPVPRSAAGTNGAVPSPLRRPPSAAGARAPSPPAAAPPASWARRTGMRWSEHSSVGTCSRPGDRLPACWYRVVESSTTQPFWVQYSRSQRQLGQVNMVDVACGKELLCRQVEQPFQGLDVSPHACPSPNAMLCTYLRWFARPTYAPRGLPGHVTQIPVSASAMTAF